MGKDKRYVPRVYFWRNRVLVPAAIHIVGPILAKVKGLQRQPYHPQSRVFLLVANHNETLDPGYEMINLGRYIRYVSSDHVVRSGFMGWFLNFFGTPIVKYRDHPKEEVTENILATVKAGIPVGVHAEGGMSFNGESRYISPNTAKLVKDAGCAMITYRGVGGYLRSPRWKKHHRSGPLTGGVVREYSREELAAMTEDEVYHAICRDLYVNVYEEQRKDPKSYTGEDLAESCEIVLYRCPKCGKIGQLSSIGDWLSCRCGQFWQMGEDGFFHRKGQRLVYDNIRDWEHWQRESLPAYLDGFRERLDTPVFRDEEQILVRVENGKEAEVSRHAVLELYHDRMELRWETGRWSAPLSEIEKMDYVKWQSLLVVTATEYFDVSAETPRSPTKYMDAWRYLTGRPNY